MFRRRDFMFIRFMRVLRVTSTMMKTDVRPTDFEYALLSKHIYDVRDSTLTVGTTCTTPFRTWTICFASCGQNGYFGAIYECHKTRQYVVVHQGTNNLLDFVEDYCGILKNRCSNQKREAFRLVELSVQKIRKEGHGYSLSFTGHSLGAFLAELSVYFAHVVLNFPEVNAVTFESPGSFESMTLTCNCLDEYTSFFEKNFLSKIKKGNSKSTSQQWICMGELCHKVSPKKFQSVADKLDIISYVSYPNLINTCNRKVGTVFADVTLDNWGTPGAYAKALFCAHKISKIVDWFERAEKEDPNCVRLHMANWPRQWAETKVFFKHAVFKDRALVVENCFDDDEPIPIITGSNRRFPRHYYSYPLSTSSLSLSDAWLEKQKKKFELQFQGNFQVIKDFQSYNSLPLRHFSPHLQQFLQFFFDKRNYIFTKYNTERNRITRLLQETWKGFNMPEDIASELLQFEIGINKLYITQVECKSLSLTIHTFRYQLSSWIHKTGFSVEDLLDEVVIDEELKY